MDIAQAANPLAASAAITTAGGNGGMAPGAGGLFAALLGGMAVSGDTATGMGEGMAGTDSLLVDPALVLLASGDLPPDGEAPAGDETGTGEAISPPEAGMPPETAAAIDPELLVALQAQALPVQSIAAEPQPTGNTPGTSMPPASQVAPADQGADALAGGGGTDLIDAAPAAPQPDAQATEGTGTSAAAASGAGNGTAQGIPADVLRHMQPVAHPSKRTHPPDKAPAMTPAQEPTDSTASATAATAVPSEAPAKPATASKHTAPAKIAETASDGSTVAAEEPQGDEDAEAAIVNGAVRAPEAAPKPLKSGKSAKTAAAEAPTADPATSGTAHKPTEAPTASHHKHAEEAASGPDLGSGGNFGTDRGRDHERHARDGIKLEHRGVETPAAARGADAASFAESLREARPVLRNLPLHPASEQVAVHVQRNARDGVKEMTVQLTPHDLGRIDIKLEFGQDGRVTASVAAEKAQTLDLLQRDARGLERALQDAGLRTDGGALSFNLRGGQSQQQGQPGGHQGYAQATRSRGTEADTAEPPPEVRRYVVGPGRVDVRI